MRQPHLLTRSEKDRNDTLKTAILCDKLMGQYWMKSFIYLHTKTCKVRVFPNDPVNISLFQMKKKRLCKTITV